MAGLTLTAFLHVSSVKSVLLPGTGRNKTLLSYCWNRCPNNEPFPVEPSVSNEQWNWLWLYKCQQTKWAFPGLNGEASFFLLVVSLLMLGCFLIRSECEGWLTQREMSKWPSCQTDLGAVCLRQLVTGYWTLKPGPVPSVFALITPPPLCFTHTWTPFLRTFQHILYMHAVHLPHITWTHAVCLVAQPAALIQWAALQSLYLDRWVCEKHFPYARGSLYRGCKNGTRSHVLMGMKSCSEAPSVCMHACMCNIPLIMLLW